MMLYLVLFVAFVIALLWLFQIVLLDDFYRWDKTNQVRQASDIIVDNIDNEQLNHLIDRLAGENDVCILLLDENGRTLRSSEDIRFCLIHRMSSRDLSSWLSIMPEDGSVLTELFNVQFPQMAQYNSRFFRGPVPPTEMGHRQSLLCARRVTLSGGSTAYLLLNAIITPLDTTVSTLRSQLVLITIAVLLGAVLLALFIARRVTRPIIETNAAARDLAHGQYLPPDHGGTYREMAELNDTLSRAAEELSQVDRLQHELIANISHDLRTPLTMIGGYAEVMRDLPGEATPENLQIIIDESSRLTSLVNEVMDFSRLQAGSSAMEAAPFAFTDSVTGIVARVSKLTEKDGYRILFEHQESLWALGDPKRIEQVVYNLLGNALTYTGEDKLVTVRQEKRGETVRISIQDTGKGISAEELPLIWNRYYRTKETHRRAIIGSGLGLSIVRSILELHGARYGVESTPDQGTCFWFELPLAKASSDHVL